MTPAVDLNFTVLNSAVYVSVIFRLINCSLHIAQSVYGYYYSIHRLSMAYSTELNRMEEFSEIIFFIKWIAYIQLRDDR